MHFFHVRFVIGIIIAYFHTQSPKSFKLELYNLSDLIGGELNLSKIEFSGIDLRVSRSPQAFWPSEWFE